MSGLVDDLLPDVDGILGIRDDLGVRLRKTCLVTRTWTGEKPGEGIAMEEVVEMLPSPYIVDKSHDMRIREGGTVQQGDLFLKSISKHTFPTQDLIDGSTELENVEKFYEVGGVLYVVIKAVEKHLTWQVQLRPLSDQTRY